MVKTANGRTSTTSFGAKGRQGHDSSSYYARRINGSTTTQSDRQVPYSENPLPDHLTNQILLDSAIKPDKHNRIPPRSVHLMVTSPPYAVGKDYDEDLSFEEYRKLLRNAWKETKRVLVPGGRACINVANLGRKPYIPLHAYIIQDMQRLGFMMRGEIIWDKGSSAGSSTAWGSWKSASNPCIRDQHEYILIFSKDGYRRPRVEGRENSIGRDEFMSSTRSMWHLGINEVNETDHPLPSVWEIHSESATRVGHPAPFPVALPERCIELYTYKDEVVYDPFMGSGTTGVAAIVCGRRFVGYEIDQDYQQRAMQRIHNTQRKHGIESASCESSE